tara:strand:- start:1194 stop:1691 length:498 start_codon:yes stop_codon:yes gene_type:complete
VRLSGDRRLLDAITVCSVAAANLSNPIQKQVLAGFLCVAATTTIEDFVRNLYTEFASRNSPPFEAFVVAQFDKFNARLRLAQIKEDFTGKIGGNYYSKFNRLRSRATTSGLLLYGRDPFSAYSDLIQWRNDFVHERRLPPATLEDVLKSILLSEIVLDCLRRSLR